MSAATAQAVWCRWPLAERLALIARWQARQSLDVRSGLSLLPEQAPAATDKTTTHLPDGRHQVTAFGPLGVVELRPQPLLDSALGLVHLAWACALGNGVLYQSDDEQQAEAIESLRGMLVDSDPALESLLQVQAESSNQSNVQRLLSADNLYMLITPSADVPLLIKHALHASRVSGVVLVVNHSLHHEVQRRLPKLCGIENIDELLQPLQAGDIYLCACASIAETLQQLLSKTNRRTALYSGDWAEVEAACDAAMAHGSNFAVNTVDAPPLGLSEARALYQRPSLTVIAHAAQ